MKRNTGKPPAPKYHYELVTAPTSEQSARIEAALRDPLGAFGLSLFAIRRGSGLYHVMCDCGAGPLGAEVLAKAKAMAVAAARKIDG